jgi:hypothetical protein
VYRIRAQIVKSAEDFEEKGWVSPGKTVLERSYAHVRVRKAEPNHRPISSTFLRTNFSYKRPFQKLFLVTCT